MLSTYLDSPPAPPAARAAVLLDALDDLHEVVGGVRGQRVPARVHAERGAARHLQLEAHVAGRRVEELRVPVSVRRHRRRQRDAARPQGDLRCDSMGLPSVKRSTREGTIK